jgi:death on curing protein
MFISRRRGMEIRETRFITVKEAIFHHFLVMKRYGEGEQSGVKDIHLLESAIGRPQQSAFGEEAYPDFFMKVATFFDSLVNNHCFHNGNKRTAVAIITTFLKVNGYVLLVDPEILEDVTVAIAFKKNESSLLVDLELIEQYEALMHKLSLAGIHLRLEDKEYRLIDISDFFWKHSAGYDF